MRELIGSNQGSQEGSKMSEGINTDKVIVNAGGGSDSGGMQAAALVAALGQRNQGNDNAALIAALGNRNDDNTGILPAMLAMNNRHPGYGYGDGFGGMNGILGIAALGLIFGRGGRGGLFGGGDDCGGGNGAETRLQSNADTLALLQANAATKDAVTGGFATTALALSQGFANTKDSVQASTFLLTNQINNVNTNVSEQGCQTREAICAAKTEILSAIATNRIAELEDQVRRLHTHGDTRDSEIRMTQVVNQNQQQAQQQQQFQTNLDLALTRFAGLIGNQFIASRQGQDIVNFGSGSIAGSGLQSTANNQVR